MDELERAIRELRKTVEMVHQPETMRESGRRVCVRCMEMWPCRTREAADAVIKAAGR